MLSTSPEPSTDTQAIPSSSAVRSPSVTVAIPSATSLDRARLLERADHDEQAEEEEQGRPLDAASASSSGWRVISSITVAPASATVAGSRPIALWTKNTTIVATRIGTVR